VGNWDAVVCASAAPHNCSGNVTLISLPRCHLTRCSLYYFRYNNALYTHLPFVSPLGSSAYPCNQHPQQQIILPMIPQADLAILDSFPAVAGSEDRFHLLQTLFFDRFAKLLPEQRLSIRPHALLVASRKFH